MTFGAIGDISEYFGRSNAGAVFVPSDFAGVAGASMTIIGAACMIVSRWQLRHLTVAELVFARNDVTVHTGLYRYLRHPMYTGLFLILFGSFFLYPNAIAVLPLACSIGFVHKKEKIEEMRGYH